ncbi:MAG: hypothetical protein KDD25_03765 [Bdellovibrionales bacterium]|nr:hypothetical protein [Bdellovibrionales bacterium]
MKWILLLVTLYAGASFAKDSSKKTDLSFDEILVQGKYHFNDEAVVTVEQDKILDSLLEVRKDFKDRIELSYTRY